MFLAKLRAGCRRSFPRHFLHGKTTLALATLAVAIAQLLFAASLKAQSTDRPHVVLILADDQSYRDFGFMGNRLVHTPHLDQLAANSARYPNGYVPMSVCRPSLATLLTGLYPHQHGIHFNHPPPGLAEMRRTLSGDQYRRARAEVDYLIQDVATLPRILARHGYACLQTGKHWEGAFANAGFTEGMTTGMPAPRLGPITGTRKQDNGDPVAHGNGDAGLVIGRETMAPIDDFLDRHAGKKPLFLWYAPFLPHTPFDAPQRFTDVYRQKSVPDHLLPYYAEIARFDETVGHLLGALEDRKLLGNTLIVFAADNGFRPDPADPDRQDQRSKLSHHEDGLRTPILLRWDSVIQPAEHRQLVHTIDLVPTILSAVGLAGEKTSRMQGSDLMPSARGDQKLAERPVFGAIYPNDARVIGKPSQHVRGRWIRQGRYKLVVPGPARNSIALCLFDLQEDPLETHNLAAAPEHARRIERMKSRLQAWWAAGDDRLVTQRKTDRLGENDAP